MREKKGGALQKLKKRLSHSFGRLSKFKIVFSHIYFQLSSFVQSYLNQSNIIEMGLNDRNKRTSDTLG